MTGYLIRRVAQAAVVVLLVTVITFILLRAIPGNVAVAILGPSGFRNPATLAAFNREYGFDKPWFDQYLLWLGHLLQGNLGFSWTLDLSVSSELGEHLPKTIILAGLATLLALVVAVPVGLWQATQRNKLVDYTFTGFSFLFYASPTFFVGTVLILVFSVKLHIFGPEGPQGGLVSDLTDWRDMTLPVVTLALVTIALFSRYMRSAVLDTLTEDYAGRDHRQADPGTDRRPAPPARHGPGHPRPRRHRGPRRPGRGHVRRPRGGDHQHRRAVRQPPPSLHRGPTGKSGTRKGPLHRLYTIPGQPPDLTAPPPGCTFAPRCRYARDKCHAAEPELTGSTQDHDFRCFFPVSTPLAVTPAAPPVPSPAAAAPVGGELLRLDHVIVGLEKATSGQILFGGDELTRYSGRERRRRGSTIQLMFQDSYASMDPRMRVATILREPLVVRYMADVIGVMYLGKLVEIGPAADVYLRPVHPYTRGLIDTVPVADPALERAKEHRGVTGELPSAVAPPSGCRFRTRCPLRPEAVRRRRAPAAAVRRRRSPRRLPLPPPRPTARPGTVAPLPVRIPARPPCARTVAPLPVRIKRFLISRTVRPACARPGPGSLGLAPPGSVTSDGNCEHPGPPGL